MRRHLTNAGYGILDYISYPAGMLLVAPIVLHRLGAAEYGLWMIATAVISVGGIIASGFSDACIQRVAHLRGAGESERIPEVVSSILAINVTLGAILAVTLWFAAPIAVRHVAASQPTSECLVALRAASVAIVVRAIESVAVCAQRAFEQYRGTVQISAAMRLITLASAAALATFGQGTISILLATCLWLIVGAAAQFRQLRIFMGKSPLWPGFHASETRILLRRGFFVWIQALGGVVFGQLDRILLGVSLGALIVTPYSLCVQFAHPITGLSASGLSFLFPLLSNRAGAAQGEGFRAVALKAFLCNLIIVACGSALLLIWGDQLIRVWAGPVVAESAMRILPPIVAGSALMGLSVTGTYTLQALGEFQMVAFILLGGRAAVLFLMIEMLSRHGLPGLAISRLCFGVISMLVYLPLLQKLRTARSSRNLISPLAISLEVKEASKQ